MADATSLLLSIPNEKDKDHPLVFSLTGDFVIVHEWISLGDYFVRKLFPNEGAVRWHETLPSGR